MSQTLKIHPNVKAIKEALNEELKIYDDIIYNGKANIKSGHEIKFFNLCYDPESGDIKNYCTTCIEGIGYKNEVGICSCFKPYPSDIEEKLNNYSKSLK